MEGKLYLNLFGVRKCEITASFPKTGLFKFIGFSHHRQWALYRNFYNEKSVQCI